MNTNAWTLGLDISTQSISAAVLDPGASPARVVAERSIPYRDDPRLNRFGINHDSLLVPPRVSGEADQPAEMFLAGLDAILQDLADEGVEIQRIGAVSVSAQQHGHVYLNEQGRRAISALAEPRKEAGMVGAAADVAGSDLPTRFTGAFAYGTAPIWQTADSQPQADEIRAGVGGTETVVNLSGSDSPARFTGAVIRRTARRYPDAWRATATVHLLSSLFSAVLTGDPDCPIDWGNGSGMTLMDYRERQWSPELVTAVAQGLPGGPERLREVLPGLAAPVFPVGRIAPYFQEKYGFDPGCVVNAGSGDNPQSKVMIDGDLLSLGTSFVYMVDTGEPRVDLQGFANSMYDGIGRPFVFACRTNGAMVWDRLRSTYGADLEQAEAALRAVAPGSLVEIWQPYAESYPVAPPIENEAVRSGTARSRAARSGSAAGSGDEFARLYSAIVDSALVLTRHYARGFERESDAGPLALTGGPAASPSIRARVAAVFQRPVVVLGGSGAALGSALSAWKTLCDTEGRDARLEEVRTDLVPPGAEVAPDPELVAAYQEITPGIVATFQEKARIGT